MTVNVARALKHSGLALSPVTSRLPIGPRTIDLLTLTRFLHPVPDPELAVVAIKEFLQVPVQWYMHLAISTSRHARVRLSKVTVPAMFVAGKHDLLAGSRDMKSAADRIPGAGYLELDGSHFVQIEQPERVHELLLDFIELVGLVSRPRGRRPRPAGRQSGRPRRRRRARLR